MNRKLLGAAAAVSALAMVLAAGCSNSKNSSSSASSSKASSGAKDVTLTVWESLQGPDEFIKQAGKAYSDLHPNVKINFVNVELGDAGGQIALDGPAGVGPDLFAAPHDKLGELVAGGHIKPTVGFDIIKSEVLGACSKALTYDGVMYGYPVSAETYALFYNKALVSESELPKTWEDLIPWAQNFNAKNPGKRGFEMDIGNGYYTIIFTTLRGNRLFGSSGTDSSSTYLSTAASVEGMKIFQSLRTAFDVPLQQIFPQVRQMQTSQQETQRFMLQVSGT